MTIRADLILSDRSNQAEPDLAPGCFALNVSVCTGQRLAAGIRGTFFNEMPVHCKKAKLAERDFYLPGALAESDPKRAAMPADGHGSPGRGTPPTLKAGQRSEALVRSM